MQDINYYLKELSARGDKFGGSGGVLDLLFWCNKASTREVNLEEAKRFLEDPKSPYEPEKSE